MPGDDWRRFAGLRTLAFYQMTHPGAKLSFMGDEIAQQIEWRYYESIEWFLAKDFDATHGAQQRFIEALNHFYAKQRGLWQNAYTCLLYTSRQREIGLVMSQEPEYLHRCLPQTHLQLKRRNLRTVFSPSHAP